MLEWELLQTHKHRYSHQTVKPASQQKEKENSEETFMQAFISQKHF